MCMEEEAPVIGFVSGMRDVEKFERMLSRIDEWFKLEEDDVEALAGSTEAAEAAEAGGGLEVEELVPGIREKAKLMLPRLAAEGVSCSSDLLLFKYLLL